jgi:hypothetical protein
MLRPKAIERPHDKHIERAAMRVGHHRSKTSRVFAALAFSSYSATTSRPRVAITRSTSGSTATRWETVRAELFSNR